MNVAEHVTKSSIRHGARTAFISSEGSVTFEEFESKLNRTAHGLLARGLRKGDRVALLFGNTVTAVQALWGCYKAGIVPVTINPRHPAAEIQRQLDHSGAGLIIADDRYAELVADAAVETITPTGTGATSALEALLADQPETPPVVEIHPDDELYQFYGSGTTGEPKCIVETHRRWIYVCSLYFSEFDVTVDRDDRVAHLAPVIHASGTTVLPHYMRGAANCLIDTPETGAFLESVERWRVTRSLLVPTLLTRLVGSDEIKQTDVSSLRHIIYSASPMNEPLMRECIGRFGPIFEQIYGFAEYGPVTLLPRSDHPTSTDAAWPAAATTVGRVIRGTTVELRDEAGEPVGRSEPGEIWVRGPGVFSGYWRDPERTDDVLTDGFVRSGDTGWFDDDGYLRLMGRKNDMIISGGYNVYPASVEAAIASLDDIRECAVFGVPDTEWGERIVAAVAADGDPAVISRAVREHCRQVLPTYEVPKEVICLPELPKNPNGKILRRELRAPYWASLDREIH